MTNSVNPSDRWRTSHLALVRALVVAWTGFVVAYVAIPSLRDATTRGLILGTGAMLPHIWLGQRLWHDSNRKGIGIPIAILSIRFIASLILFSVFLWQFPSERYFVAWTGSSLIIVFTVIEAFLFAKGVGRL
ncbi:MAG: hypothetical protein RL173_56 [Fibrobacterota bacterium]|jgi:hypothetical protein